VGEKSKIGSGLLSIKVRAIHILPGEKNFLADAISHNNPSPTYCVAFLNSENLSVGTVYRSAAR